MEEFLPLKKAAQISGYHQDYLSFLLRKKEIKGKRAGPKLWLIEEKSFFRYLLRKKFVPLEKIIFSKSLIVFFFFFLSFGFLLFSSNFFFQEKIMVGKDFLVNQKNELMEVGKEIKEEGIKLISKKI
ncbi:MAG: hypothetical protein ACPLZH_03415 [Minisyncoccales bacterium]